MIRRVFLSFFICFLIISCNKKEDEVSQIEATSVSISEADVTISIGGREKLEIIVEPEGVDLSRSVWRSSDTNIVKVDEKGVVTARAEGKATVSYTTSNSLSKQCKFTVVSSPVSSLVLPDPDFPIGIGLKMFLMGQGFTSGQKIWFRPLQRGDGFKNGNDGDILGVIHEVASNYISVTGGVSGGWYSLLLESGGELFNLGNFQFATYTVPPFEYDPNKILWDDTHWRLFHLRGKVKRMVIQTSTQYWTKYLSLDFNSNGFLIKQSPNDIEDPAYTTYYEYDNQNRLIKKFGSENISYGDYQTIYFTVKYSYGNHDNYINVDFLSDYDEVAISSPNIHWFDLQMYPQCCFYPIIMYYKGLVNVDLALKTTKGDRHFNMNIIFAGDSAYCNKSNSFGSKEYLKWKFKNGFPVLSTCYSDRPLGFEDYACGYFAKFQSNGMVGSIRHLIYRDHDTISNDTIAVGQVSFFPSKPFLMLSEDRPISYNWNNIFTRFLYDSNEDMFTSSCYTPYEIRYYLHYMSYDKYGNWNQCIVVDNLGDYSLYKRDITYW